METRFKVINVPLGHGKETETKYFDSLFEALKESNEVYEVDKNDKDITWIWRELPEKIWHIVNCQSKKSGKEAEDF